MPHRVTKAAQLKRGARPDIPILRLEDTRLVHFLSPPVAVLKTPDTGESEQSITHRARGGMGHEWSMLHDLRFLTDAPPLNLTRTKSPPGKKIGARPYGEGANVASGAEWRTMESSD